MIIFRKGHGYSERPGLIQFRVYWKGFFTFKDFLSTSFFIPRDVLCLHGRFLNTEL